MDCWFRNILAAEPKVSRKAIGSRLILKKAHTYVNNRLLIVHKQGKTGKPSGVSIDMQPEQSTADTAIQLGIISNSSSERRQRKRGWKRGSAGRHPACAAARQGKGKAPGAGKHRQPERNKPPQAVQGTGEPRIENLPGSRSTTNPSERRNKEGRAPG